EYDNSVNPLPPTGIRVAYNYITANAGDCDAIGLRMTSMQLAGSVTYTGNNVTTTNAGKNGRDYSLSFSDVNEVGTNFQYSGNTFRSQYAYVTVDWDGAYVVVPAGQSWLGAPKYSIDNENGGNGGGPTFTQSITVDDSTPGTIHCGANAKGYTREGSQSVQCNNQSGNPL
ncbi:MAG TPA: hypothetical protein VNX22_04585, partial [Acidobacteriaceae bacterium]|nr:hypothetical protein [Acidobacteriaceae bacterium]